MKVFSFWSSYQFTSYAGLIPSVYQSGSKSYAGKITKQGNKFICWAFTEAAQSAIKYSEYSRYYYSKARAKQDANKVAIAVARRMTEIAYVLLKEKR